MTRGGAWRHEFHLVYLDLVHDIIIIGGGPSGSQAASIAVENGFDVLLLERGVRGDYKACSGIYASHNFNGLPALPESFYERDLVTTRFMSSSNDGLLDAREFGTTLGKVVLRSNYDKQLIDLAESKGATVMEHANVKRIEVKHDKVTVHCSETSLSGSSGGGPAGVASRTEHEARVVFLASGATSYHLNEQVGLEVPRIVNSIVGEFKSSEEHVERVLSSGAYHYYLNKQNTKVGPFWITCRADGTFNAGIIDYTVSKDALVSIIKHDPRVKDLFTGASERTPPGRNSPYMMAPIPANPVKKPYGDRVLALGDAAGLVQQFYYEGVYQGRQSAVHAVQTLVELREAGKSFTADNLSIYKKYLAEHIVNAFSRSGRRNSYLFWKSRDDDVLWYHYCEAVKKSRKFRKLLVACYESDYTDKDYDKMAGEMLYNSIPILKRILYTGYFIRAISVK
ncbi:MAG: NAD(P)/FAD-dependent oxidoreductase [Promethearchaeota archaeon]